MPKARAPAESERVRQAKLRLRAVQRTLDLRNADMAHELGVQENTYANWIGADPKRGIPEAAALRLWQRWRIPMEFIYGGDLTRTEYDLAAKLREACAQEGAVCDAPMAEFPMQTEHTGRAPARVPPKRRGNFTVHEGQAPPPEGPRRR